MEFLEWSSAMFSNSNVEALVVSVANVLFVFVPEPETEPDAAEAVVLIHRPTRPWIAGFPGLGRVKESLDSMRCTLYMSGRSDTMAWQHSRPSCTHSAASSASHEPERSGSMISSDRPSSDSFHV
jgi:hypothetical protein